ncbi:unnamed protein product [Ectocarpus sp. 13 AM-2016]
MSLPAVAPALWLGLRPVLTAGGGGGGSGGMMAPAAVVNGASAGHLWLERQELQQRARTNIVRDSGVRPPEHVAHRRLLTVLGGRPVNGGHRGISATTAARDAAAAAAAAAGLSHASENVAVDAAVFRRARVVEAIWHGETRRR